ncbi:hypothetical protein [Leptospira phage LE4]|uniref:Uncharacterized protein n=1 Tax=Leptospira phage LE4 TaxID=2041383 RepID=A0A343LEB9_9CAUD|nr:hypothetical protein HWB34_gp16 [Leptospira phage LE4]ATN95029.1 hypothetical protein [Leptospira phage LE4]
MDLREKIAEIRIKYLSGEFTYEQAKKTAEPLIDQFNAKAKEIAKKHKRKPLKVSFVGMMR